MAASCVFRDVSDALVGYRKNQELRIQHEQLTHWVGEGTKLSTMRYKGGATSPMEVLDSDSRFFTAQLSLARADLSELQSACGHLPSSGRQTGVTSHVFRIDAAMQ